MNNEIEDIKLAISRLQKRVDGLEAKALDHAE